MKSGHKYDHRIIIYTHTKPLIPLHTGYQSIDVGYFLGYPLRNSLYSMTAKAFHGLYSLNQDNWIVKPLYKTTLSLKYINIKTVVLNI